MHRIHLEPLGFGCPLLADEFLRCLALQGIEPASGVVGVDEVGQMLMQLCVVVVVEVLQRAYTALNAASPVGVLRWCAQSHSSIALMRQTVQPG